MNMYDLTVPHFVRLLTQVHRWLDKAQAHAAQKKFDPEVLLHARLAPDQFPLVRQIQITGDHAKNGAARLAGLEAPRYEDNEATLDELRARVTKTIEWLNTLQPAQFEGAEGRNVALPFVPGKYLVGSDYLSQLCLPNVYFHATTAYAILRHNGVDLGKMDFLGELALRDA